MEDLFNELKKYRKLSSEENTKNDQININTDIVYTIENIKKIFSQIVNQEHKEKRKEILDKIDQFTKELKERKKIKELHDEYNKTKSEYSLIR